MGTRNGRVCVREVESGKIVWSRTNLNHRISQIQFSRDNKRLLERVWFECSSLKEFKTHELTVLDLRTGEEIPSIKEGIAAFGSKSIFSTFSPDGRWLGVVLTNHVIRVLNAVDGKLIAELTNHSDQIRMVTFSGTAPFWPPRARTARRLSGVYPEVKLSEPQLHIQRRFDE